MADEGITVDPMDNPDLVPPLGPYVEPDGSIPFMDPDGFAAGGWE